MKLFKKKKVDTLTLMLLKEYGRLVYYGKPDEFLDTDTIQIMDYRDELEEGKQDKKLSSEELKLLDQIDAEFKLHTAKSIESYTKRIRSGDESADYLKGILQDLSTYGKEEPVSSWWFHLLEDHEQS